MEWLWQDVRYASRLCRRNPGFAAAAIVSLALGIGANTLLFSIVNALVLEPLPIEKPEQVVFVQSSAAGTLTHSFPNYRDFRDRNSTFAGLIGYRISPMSLEMAEGATRVWGYLATGNYFEVLGIKPAAGRFFTADDDRQPGAAPFAVLSHDAWQRRFFGDPGVIGRTIRINRLSFTIVGVAPRGFQGTELFYRPEIWVPMMMQAQIEVGNPWLEVRQTFNTWVAGRLRPGITPAAAEANLNAIAADLQREHAWANRDLSVTLTRPGLLGDALRAPVSAFMTGILILAALVLLAGCANLASILLAHGADRQREMALRVSLGAGRARLMRQLLIESALLSLTGGAIGAGLAVAAASALSSWRLPLDLPVQFDVHADARALAFGIGASILAGIIFGLAPARQASRIDPNATLKGGVNGAHAEGRRWALRDALVALQVALCFVLLAACLLSVKGLQQALALPLGFDPRGASVAGFDLGLAGYTEEQGRDFQQRVLAAVSRLPGVEAAAYASSLPLSIDQSTTTVSPEHEPSPGGAETRGVTIYQASPGLIRALGMRLLSGRDLDTRDRRESPAVAIVNERFARRVLQTRDAVGSRFRYGRGDQLVEIVGVVEDGKYTTLSESPRPMVLQPIAQRYNSTTTVVARSSLPEEQIVAAMRRAIAELDPALPVYGAGSLNQLVALAWLPNRVAALVLSAFGVLALALAATGIHGLVAYSVARRQKEIGVRVAVGASRADVLRLVLSRASLTLAVGSAVGLLLALSAGSVLASIVYQASPRDPLVFIAVGLILIGIGIVSCWAPLRRSLRIDPMTALRSE